MASAGRVRPSVGLHNLGRGKAAIESKRVTTCKVCGRGVFESEPHRWFLSAPIGISHDTCRPGEVTA